MLENLLHGERVRLTALTADDLPAIARWQNGDYLRLFDALPAMPKTVEQLSKWLETTQASSSGYVFAIREIDGDELIGYLELEGILWPHRVCGVSLAIGDAANRRRGYGSEALSLALRFAFHELNLQRVQLGVFDYNTNAIRSYERLGFTHEGTLRQFLERDGRRHDMLLYGLLRDEWVAIGLGDG